MTVNQLIKEMIPEGTKINVQAQDLIFKLAMNFVHHLGDVANDECNEAKKKTITPEHAIAAMLQLKLEGYVKEILAMKQTGPQSKKPVDMGNRELKE